MCWVVWSAITFSAAAYFCFTHQQLGTIRFDSPARQAQYPDCEYPLVPVSRKSTANDRLPLSLYPNPTTGRLTLNLPDDAAGNWLLHVHGLDGRLISETPLPTTGGSTETTLPDNLPAGLYLIELQNESKFYNARVVLEKRYKNIQ